MLSKSIRFFSQQVYRDGRFSLRTLNSSHREEVITLLNNQFVKRQPLSKAYLKKYPHKQSQLRQDFLIFFRSFMARQYFNNNLSVGLFDTEKNDQIIGTILSKQHRQFKIYPFLDFLLKFRPCYDFKMILNALYESLDKTKIKNIQGKILWLGGGVVKQGYGSNGFAKKMLKAAQCLGFQKGFRYQFSIASNIRSASAFQKLKYIKIGQVNPRTFVVNHQKPFQFTQQQHNVSYWINQSRGIQSIEDAFSKF